MGGAGAVAGATVRVGVLGGLHVTDEDGREIAVGGPVPRALLTAFVLAEGRLVRTDVLLDSLDDGEPPASALNTLTAGDAEGALAVLQDAEALWRGPALVEVAERDFARPVAVRLTERRSAALEDRVEAQLRLGRHDAVLGELGQLADAHPSATEVEDALQRVAALADEQGNAVFAGVLASARSRYGV